MLWYIEVCAPPIYLCAIQSKNLLKECCMYVDMMMLHANISWFGWDFNSKSMKIYNFHITLFYNGYCHVKHNMCTRIMGSHTFIIRKISIKSKNDLSGMWLICNIHVQGIYGISKVWWSSVTMCQGEYGFYMTFI